LQNIALTVAELLQNTYHLSFVFKQHNGEDLNSNIKHHLATAIAFVFLILWYYALHKLNFFEFISSLFSQQYQGSGLMLAIGLGMTPAFFIWSRFNRWVEKKLQIKGKYYEDGFYKEPKKEDDKKA